jgi:hypothetical protein
MTKGRVRMNWTKIFTAAFGVVALSTAAIIGCAVGVRRDLSKTPPNEVIFDDHCHLQDYFDDMARGLETPPTLVRSDEIQTIESDRSLGGRSVYRFGDNSSLKAFRRLLAENWKPVPVEIMQASEVDIEVRWCEKVGTRWVVNDDKVELSGGGKVVSMAPHPCLTSFLFGKDLYERRREVLGLPAIPAPVAASQDAGGQIF